MGQVGGRAAPAIVGQVRRAEKNGKAGTGETSGTGGSASRTGDCGTGETSGRAGRVG